jgi:hypothetical protein
MDETREEGTLIGVIGMEGCCLDRLNAEVWSFLEQSTVKARDG